MTWQPLLLSLQVATIATLIAVVLGTLLAIVVVWKRLPFPNLVGAIISTPLVLPPTVLGYYLLVALGPNSVIGRAYHWLFDADIVFTFTAAVIAATVGSIPFVVGAVRVGIESVEPTLLAAARTLGASPLRVLVTVTLPLTVPSMAAGAMLAFARALGDYGMTQMVASSRFNGLLGITNQSPASIFVYDQLVAQRDDAARSMALATTIVGISMLLLANRLTRRLHHRG